MTVIYTTGFCAVGEPSLTVCIKPSTELAFDREIECEALLFTQLARFRRVSEDRKFVHHDALELPSGKVVLLTRLLVRPTRYGLAVAGRGANGSLTAVLRICRSFKNCWWRGIESGRG
jgi:hypothetical protein